MGIVLRQTVKTSGVMIAGALLGGLLIYAQSHLMTKTDVGFSRLLTNISVMTSVILTLGIPNAVGVFIHQFSDDAKKRSTFLFLSFAIPIIILLLGTIPYVFMRNYIAGKFTRPEDGVMFLKYYWTFPVYILGFSITFLSEQILFAFHKTALTSFLKEILFRVINILLVLAFAFTIINYHVFIWGWALAMLFIGLLVYHFAWKTKKMQGPVDLKVFSVKEYKEFARFAMYHLFLGFTVTLIGYLDSNMLAPLDHGGLSAVTIYTNAIFLVTLMTIPQKPIWLSTYPELAKAYQSNDMVRCKDVFERSSLSIQVVTMIMLVLLICNAEMATTFFGKGYEAVATVTIILAIGRFIDMITGMNDNMLSISRHYQYFAYFTIGILVIMVAGLRWSIPVFGVYGAAWTTTIVLCLYNFIKWLLLKKKLNFDSFSPATLKVLLIGFIAFLPGWWLPRMENIYLDIFIRSAVICILYFVGLLWLKPAPDVDKFLQNIIKNKRLF